MDVVPGTVQLPEEHSQFKMGHLWCVFHVCFTNILTVEEKEEEKISPEETEDGDGDGESDERQRVSNGVHCLHEGKIPVGI